MIDGVGDGAEIAFDLRVLEREIGFQDRKNAVGAERLPAQRLFDRVGRGGGGNAGDHRHAPVGRFDGRPHHGFFLRAGKISELAGGAERREPMHAGLDQVVAQLAEHVGLDCGSASIGETR